ncbi:hypothetical protein BT67DRAFT_382717 [Trichocladium antarcticum]|uniref:Uncharacterized protein n=1 Tax=Trichocladium antarcticum TaxID=1450529 RepID=A0AAN6UI89_9PEZI|nr:hypothetical protein BT67DRAFT_382717 [Trichocladium antarcticum]
MGAVVSCIKSALRTIGRTIMAILNGIASIIMAIVNGVVSFIGVIVGFLTCNTCGGRRKHGGRSHATTTGRSSRFGRRRHMGTARV